MKHLLFGLLLLSQTIAIAQTIEENDLRTVTLLLTNEDYKGAFEKTTQLLSHSKNDSSDIHGIVMYMNVFSAAGMVSKQEMSYDDFIKNIDQYIGQKLIMPGHPCVDSGKHHTFNTLRLFMREKRLEGFTIASNKSITSILCFEYFKYLTDPDYNSLVGKNVTCGGVLESFETNPNKDAIWIVRLHLKNSFAQVL